jgi:hypothetical protein
MAKSLSLLLAAIIGGHGFLGLFVEGEHLLGIFSVDITLDLVYLGCAALLLVAAVPAVRAVPFRLLVAVVAVAQLALLLAGLADRDLYGAAPTGLTLMDDVVFLANGGAAAVIALLPHPEVPLWEETTRARAANGGRASGRV